MTKKVIVNPNISDSSNKDNETILLISNYIYNILKENNVDATIIEENNPTLSEEDRTNIINSIYTPSKDNIIISNDLINTNKGTEIIYALRNTNKLATKINDELENNNLIVNKYYQQRLPSDTSKDYHYIIRNTNPAETIIVNYDLENNGEQYIDYAKAISNALLSYINESSYTPSPNVYTVVKGDSLYSIAQKFNTTVSNLKSLNNLSSNLLSIGQILKIPSSTLGNIYTVVKGDSLYSIAQKFNTTVSNLKSLNNLSSNLLSIGQILKIPSSTLGNIYTVVKGDSLYSIAQKFNTTVSNLKTLNNLSSNLLSIGQILKIK